MMKTTWTTMSLLAGMALAAGCGDDSSGPGTGGGGAGGAGAGGAPAEPDPFPADCERGTVEDDLVGTTPDLEPTDLVWMGPGVDPDTGELAPQEGTLIASTTYLRIKPTDEARGRFSELVSPMLGDLFGNPELVGVQLAVSERCGTARTLSVWRSIEGMVTFATSDAHTAAVVAVDEVSRGGSVVTHWEAANVASIDWDEAASRAAAVEGPVY